MSCPAGSYCKNWQCPAVCQGTNAPCNTPGVRYSCSGSSCVQDSNGMYDDCCQANCTNPTPNTCCSSMTGACGNYNGACPAGWSNVSSCDKCQLPSTTVYCCDDKPKQCSTAQNACPANLRPIDSCTECTAPLPVYVQCCDTGSGFCQQYNNSCPTGTSKVSDCSQCYVTPLPPFPPPLPVYSCCLNGSCFKSPIGCPSGYNVVSDCSKCPPVPPITDTCPNGSCAKGGFPVTFWAEHPPIGSDVNSPEITQYYQLMNKFICQPNPAGLCVNKFLLRVEIPVEPNGSRNCFYPALNSPLYTQLLVNLPTNFELYALPYFDPSISWAAYPDTASEIAELGSLATIPCTDTCNVTPCSGACPSGYQCVNGSCYTTSDQCGTCPSGQSCLLGYDKKYPGCLSSCKGSCCAGTVDPSGSGNCCNAPCDNALARAVFQVKKWNELLGRQLFKGIVVDQEGSGYSRAVIASKTREAIRTLGLNLLIGTTYDGSNIGRCIADLTATDDTKIDLAFPEVYNLTTQCNPGKDPWPMNTQLVDSYDDSPTLSGCTVVPYPATNSLYAQAWKTTNPAQTLWSGNNGVNFQSIIKYGWSKQVTQDVANRIFPLLSVETSPLSPVQTCMYPSDAGGPCGVPNAFGVWNTVQGAQQFIQFVKLFQGSLSNIFLPGSGTIPTQNFSIFSFPIMPKAWFGN